MSKFLALSREKLAYYKDKIESTTKKLSGELNKEKIGKLHSLSKEKLKVSVFDSNEQQEFDPIDEDKQEHGPVAVNKDKQEELAPGIVDSDRIKQVRCCSKKLKSHCGLKSDHNSNIF